MKYIDTEKLIAEIKRFSATEYGSNTFGDDVANGALDYVLEEIIPSLQQEQPNNMIQWTGNNLKEVIDFTGKSPRFGEWFKSWEDYENYVHTHNDILKLFCEDGSHYEVPVGVWIVKTPDGYNVPSIAKHIKPEQSEMDFDLEEYIENEINHYGLSLYEASYGTFSASLIVRIIRNAFEHGLKAKKA